MTIELENPLLCYLGYLLSIAISFHYF